eukprot:CAMPEP_0170169892 /NCGR_PEP_ID=MMETSP0040_2-20121228/2825_1 /TAXON_ID=641309 /ORGANISM="Lotharella oceanica, Strain CCMP622" /LENGTH=212 /DNA_ID=CAMNT_0010408903 /DNA_START=1220 /DNA_END=1857 /DNA_ORIENTATION=-
MATPKKRWVLLGRGDDSEDASPPGSHVKADTVKRASPPSGSPVKADTFKHASTPGSPVKADTVERTSPPGSPAKADTVEHASPPGSPVKAAPVKAAPVKAAPVKTDYILVIIDLLEEFGLSLKDVRLHQKGKDPVVDKKQKKKCLKCSTKDNIVYHHWKQRPHTSASRKNTRNKQNVQTIDAQTHVAKKTSKKQERRRCRNENDVEAFHHHK